VSPVRRARRMFQRLSLPERTEVLRALRDETTGGFLLLLGAAVAMVWANTPWQTTYVEVQEFVIGPAAWHLDLTLHTWAADGLLAVFFLVAGLELKRELVVGDLRTPSQAVLPVAAAVSGMVIPALVYVIVNVVGNGSLTGWAVPTATDIAFALAVLAVIGSFLPTSLRAFLLTLAVVDDLLAIIVIAVFFTDDLAWQPLLGAAALLGIYSLLQNRRVTWWWVYVPIALAVWALVHASGVHATVAGVAIGLLTRVRHDPEEKTSPAENLEHRLRPVSAAVCVPLFALMSAGVPVDMDALRSLFTDPVPLGVVLGLVLGKTIGVYGGTYLTHRFTRASLSEELGWTDVLGVAMLGGIGFTVSLLIGELAFIHDEESVVQVKAAVLVGSLIAAMFASFVLVLRNGVYRRIHEEDIRDTDADGIPDVYQERP
jgi:Na+:H+ antiporter, NhaA family